MTTSDILRDRRVAMIAGATLLHLSALAGAWALIPPGTETRLNRPIEASFAPAPSSDAVNMNSAPLAREVQSTNTTTATALEDTAETVPPDTVRTDTMPPVTEEGVRLDVVAAEHSQPASQPAVQSEQVAPEAPAETAEAAPPPPTDATPAPSQLTALAPDVLTTANPVESSEVPLASPPVTSSPEATVQPMASPPKPRKPEKKTVQAPRKKQETAKIQPAPKPPIQESRFARLDTSTQVRQAQKGGAGAVSDIGTASNARASGATARDYAAILLAAVNRRLRTRNFECEGGSAARFKIVVSLQGSLSTVQLVGASGDSGFDGAAAAILRSASVSEQLPKKIATILRVNCPNG